MDALIPILALKGKWTMRSAAGPGRSGLAAMARLVLFGTGAVVVAAVAYRLVRPVGGDPRPHLVHLVFLYLYGIWLLTPLLGFRGGGFPETERLAAFPMSRRRLFLVTTVVSLVDGTLLFFVPAVVAVCFAVPGSPAASVLRCVVVCVFLLHAALLQRVLALAFGEILRSRKFRDFSAVLISIVCVGLYLAIRGLSGGGEGGAAANIAHRLDSWRISETAAASPSYWFSDLLVRLPDGLLPGVAAEIGGVVLLTGFLAVAGYLLLGRSLEADRGRRQGSVEVRGNSRHVEGIAWRIAGRFLPDSTVAFAAKEFRILAREPLVKAQLIVQAGFIVLPILLTYTGTALPDEAGGRHLPEMILLGLSFSMVVVQSFLALNLFGLEGPGFLQLASAPVSRKWILVRKNAFYLLVFGSLNTAVLAAFTVLFCVSGRLAPAAALPALVPFVILQWALLALVISLGNVTSVLFPVRLASMGCNSLGFQNSGRESVGRLVLRSVATACVLLLLAPFACLVLVPHLGLFGIGSWFYAVSIPVLLGFLALIHVLSLDLADRLLGRREGELIRYLASS